MQMAIEASTAQGTTMVLLTIVAAAPVGGDDDDDWMDGRMKSKIITV